MRCYPLDKRLLVSCFSLNDQLTGQRLRQVIHRSRSRRRAGAEKAGAEKHKVAAMEKFQLFFLIRQRYPLVNEHNYGKSPFFMGQPTRNGYFQ